MGQGMDWGLEKAGDATKEAPNPEFSFHYIVQSPIWPQMISALKFRVSAFLQTARLLCTYPGPPCAGSFGVMRRNFRLSVVRIQWPRTLSSTLASPQGINLTILKPESRKAALEIPNPEPMDLSNEIVYVCMYIHMYMYTYMRMGLSCMYSVIEHEGRYKSALLPCSVSHPTNTICQIQGPLFLYVRFTSVAILFV